MYVVISKSTVSVVAYVIMQLQWSEDGTNRSETGHIRIIVEEWDNLILYNHDENFSWSWYGLFGLNQSS